MPRFNNLDREPPLIVELRASIEECRASPYRLAEKAGIHESAIRKFVARTRSLSLDSAARLCEILGLRVLRPTKPRRFAGRTRRSPAAPELVDVETPDSLGVAEVVDHGMLGLSYSATGGEDDGV
jgi:predicted transcriptional regulator